MSVRQRVGHMTMRVYALLNGELKDKIKLTHIQGEDGTFSFTYDDATYTIKITATATATVEENNGSPKHAVAQ